MTPSSLEKEREESIYFRGEKVTGTVTDHDSKTVMLSAERNDVIEISEVVRKLNGDIQAPEETSVIKRSDTFYARHCLVEGV